MRAFAQDTASKRPRDTVASSPLAVNARATSRPGLRFTTPGDAHERDADRVAERVMRMPDPGPRSPCACGGVCPRCREKQAGPGPGPARSVARDTVAPALFDRLPDSRGAPLDARSRAFFEPRFGFDFGHVRVHADARAAESAAAIGAHAYTVGRDIVLGDGQYRPQASEGRHLLAHELAHIAQRGGGGATGRAALGDATIAGRWKIDDPKQTQVKGGQSNETLLAAGFSEICNRTRVVNRGSDRVVEVQPGGVAANRREGCGCLQTVQDDFDAFAAGNKSFVKALPHIGLTVNGWSFTRAAPKDPEVQVRHPEGPFGWGYWTGGDQREHKAFFRTIAHEVCGHMAASVQGVASGRSSARGHNEAIIRENRVAAEHGVSKSRQRGLDVDESGVVAGAHRGESFIRAQLFFDHDSDVPNDPAALARVVDGVIGTIQFFGTGPDDVGRIQIEGFGRSNESTSVVNQRIVNLRSALSLAFGKHNIPDPFPDPNDPKKKISRFARDIATLLPGKSTPNTSDTGRRVDVFLFHKAHSAR